MSDNLLQPVLNSIDAWYMANVPAIHATLRPGTTDAELDAMEQRTGLKLPEAFRILYRWHDGQDWGLVEISGPTLMPLDPAEINRGGVFGLDFMPLEAVRDSWENWQATGQDQAEWDEASSVESFPTGAVQGASTTPGWLGFLADSRSNYVGLDVNPGPTGRPGQIITFGRDGTAHYVLADSLDAFLCEYERRLSSGRVSVETLEGFAYATWNVRLHDRQGEPSVIWHVLADLFPGFGAAPDDRTQISRGYR
jgi:cell wall assembly regulator SMI1